MMRIMRARPARSLGTILALFALLLQAGVALAHQPLLVGAFAPGVGLAMCHVATGNAPEKSGGTGPSAPDKVAFCSICLGLQASASFCLPVPAVAGLARALPQAVKLALPPDFSGALPVATWHIAKPTPGAKAPTRSGW